MIYSWIGCTSYNRIVTRLTVFAPSLNVLLSEPMETPDVVGTLCCCHSDMVSVCLAPATIAGLDNLRHLYQLRERPQSLKGQSSNPIFRFQILSHQSLWFDGATVVIVVDKNHVN